MHTSSAMPNLPPAIAREALHTLRGSLPPPVVASPEALLARDETAMAVLAALRPGDALEASLAADIVAAGAHAKDCFRLAVAAGRNAETVRRCRAQAAMMMRVVQSGIRSLQRTQALREKAEAGMQPAAMEQAGWWFHDVSVPDVAASPTGGSPDAGSPDAGTDADEATPPEVRPPEPLPSAAAEPSAPADAAAAAEQDARAYPDRVAPLRTQGGLPERLDFAVSDAAVGPALANGDTPVAQAIDDQTNRRSTVGA